MVENFVLLTLSKQALVFMCLQYKSFENTVGKGEIARNEQFLLFPQCFLPFWRRLHYFHKIWNWHLQRLSIWKSLNLVVWERVKLFTTQSHFQWPWKRNLLKTLLEKEKMLVFVNRLFTHKPETYMHSLYPWKVYYFLQNSCGVLSF